MRIHELIRYARTVRPRTARVRGAIARNSVRTVRPYGTLKLRLNILGETAGVLLRGNTEIVRTVGKATVIKYIVLGNILPKKSGGIFSV